MKGILSELSEQALRFIKNSFQTTALTWILSLGKKLKLFEFEEKPHCVLGKNQPDEGNGWELMGRQQHCCWESLWDYSLVKLKLQPSQTELLFRSVADSFLAMRTGEAATRCWDYWSFVKRTSSFSLKRRVTEVSVCSLMVKDLQNSRILVICSAFSRTISSAIDSTIP